MKKFLQKSLLCLMAICGLVLYSQAQIISYPTPAQSISRSLDSTLLTVRIDFPLCSNILVTTNLGASNNPGNVEYVPGSITKIGGTASLSISESNIANKRNPVFAVTNTNAGEFIIFTLKRKVNCGIGTSSKDNIRVTGSSGCNFQDLDNSVNTYNILAPALALSAVADLNNVILGNSYVRTVTLINGGNGCLDTFGFWIKYPLGSIQLDSLKINGVKLTPIAIYSNADSTYYNITGSNFGGGDRFLCSGETVTFTEYIKVLKCNAVTTYGSAWYNKESDEECQKVFTTGNIIMSGAVPNLFAYIANPDYNHCWVGETIKQTITLVNRGAAPATSITMNFNSTFTGSFQARYTFDTLTPWVIKNKLGASVGQVKNFTNLGARSVWGVGCTVFNGVYIALGSLGNLTLAPGDTVYIDVFTKSENFNCFSCTVATGWTGIQTDTRYKNQCGTANYSTGATNHMTRAYAYFDYLPSIPTDILPGVPFDLDLFFTQMQTFNNPDGSGSSMLVVPLTGTNMLPTVTSVTVGTTGVVFPVNVINDTMYIGPFIKNTYMGGLMRIRMVATCGTSGTKTLNPYINNKYGTCSPTMKFTCYTASTVLHCPDPCPKGGATPLNFSLKRITYGKADNDNNSIPDGGSAVLDLNKIDDHHSVRGDTLQGTWNIKVYPNVESTTNGYPTTDPNFGKPIAYVYIDFYLRYPQSPVTPWSLTALPDATIKIYPNSNPLAVPITGTVSPTFNGVYAHYEFDSTLRGGAWQGNDSVVIQAKYRANANDHAYGDFFYLTNNEVYSTYTKKATPQIAPVLGETYTCDHFNDYNKVSQVWYSPWLYDNQVLNGCSNYLTVYNRQYLRNQEGPNIFPYEYRNFFAADSMTVLLPPNFTYRSNSATITFYDAGGGSVAIPDSKVSQVGNKLYFTNLKTFYTINGGTITAGDETQTLIIGFSVDPQCEANNGTYYSSVRTSGIGDGSATPMLAATDPSIIRPQGVGWVYTAPQPVLSGGGLIVSSNGTATWNVVIQNAHISISANNSFFAITNSSGFSNIIVKEGATVINPINGIYQISSLAGNANRIITVTANTSTCKIDSMLVSYGWDCKNYPTSISNISCSKPLWLKMDNSISQMQLLVDKQPTGPDIPLCDVDDIEFVFNSAQTSNVNNPQIRVVPPVGLNIINAQIEYPLGSGNWEPITPTILGGVYVYTLEDHSLILSEGLFGTAANPAQAGRSAKLSILYETTCQFSSGSRFFAQIRGDRPCGGPIPVSQGYNAFLRTDPIFITGSPAGSLFSFNLGLSSTVISCGQTRISGSVTPIGGPSTNTDTILVTIPNGLIYNGGFSSSSSVSVIAGYPIAGPNNTQILALKIPQGVAIGTVISYGFDITANASSGCTDFNIFSEVKRSYSTFDCAGIPCNNPFSAIIGSQSNTLTVSRPNPVINYITYASGNFIANDSALVNVTITNTHPTLNAPANTLAVEFYCGIPGTLFETILLPIAINANSSITHQFRVHFVGSPLCATGDVLTGKIRPATSICICDSSSYTLPGVVLPVNFKNFSAQKTNLGALLKWQIADKAPNVVFGIQRSLDGVTFTSIATLNGNTALNYEHTDENPIEGKRNYYRIVQQSNATNASTTSIKMLNYLIANEIIVIANQGALFWTIFFGKDHINQFKTIQVLNSNGQVVLSKIISKSIETYNIPTQNLPNGNYILKIGNNNATIFTKKLAKF